jgi:hypothetical protein
VYEGFSHRITARALASKGLIKVKGRGATWQAVIAAAGQQYLAAQANDTATPSMPPKVEALTTALSANTEDRGRSSAAETPVREPATSGARPPVPTPRRRPARVGPVDQMMTALHESGDHGLVVSHDEATRYRQLAASAKRHGRIPDGMEIVVNPVRGERATRVALVPLPTWRTTVLIPVKVPARLRNPSDVVQALDNSATFTVAGQACARALRLVDALVTAGRDRGMRVKAATGVQTLDSRGYTSNGPRRDEVRFTINKDTFRLWITQGTMEVPHTPTARELAGAAKGHAFADRDTVPDPRLGIRLDGDGGQFWASSWSDTDDHRLEYDLAQILEEIRLRHGRLVEQRHEQARRDEQRKADWHKARERAVAAHAQAYRTSSMTTQAQQWRDAELLRSYAAAISDRIQHLDQQAREQAASWAAQILDQADRIDPLTKEIGVPDVPAPSAHDLGPFMKPHNPYAP